MSTGNIGRNDRCPCGSGRKYKRCCLSKDSPAISKPPRNPGLPTGTHSNAKWPHPQSVVLKISGGKELSLGILAKSSARDFCWTYLAGRVDEAFSGALSLLGSSGVNSDTSITHSRNSIQVERLINGGVRLVTSNFWVEIHEAQGPLMFKPGIKDFQVGPVLALLWTALGGIVGHQAASQELILMFPNLLKRIKEATHPSWPWRLAIDPESLGAELPEALVWEWISISEVDLPPETRGHCRPIGDSGAANGADESGRRGSRQAQSPWQAFHPLAVAARAGVSASELPESLRTDDPARRATPWERVWIKTRGLPARRLIDVLQEAASARLPRDLFPLLMQSDSIPQWASFQVDSNEDRIFLAWLARVLQAKVCPVWLGAGPDPSQGVPLSGISFQNQVSLQATIESVSGEYAPHEIEVVLRSETGKKVNTWEYNSFRRWKWDPETHEIAMLPNAAFVAAFRKTQSWSVSDSSADAESAGLFLRELKKDLGEQRIEIPSNLRADTAQGRVEVWLEESGAFRVCHALPESGVRIWNFPTETRALLEALQSGLGALPQTADLPLSTTGNKRTLGLKALRHQGIAAYCLEELLSKALAKTPANTPANTPADAAPAPERPIETQFLHRVSTLLDPDRAVGTAGVADTGNSARSLSELCGQRIQSFIAKDLPARLAAAIQAPLAVADDGQVLEIASPGFPLVELLLNRIRAMVADRGPEVLLRERLGWVERTESRSVIVEHAPPLGQGPPPAAQVYSMGPPGIESWLPLVEEGSASGIRLYWKGQPVESLSPDQLRIALDVKSTGDQDSQLGWDWFELHPEVFLQGEPVSPHEVLDALSTGLLSHGGKLYRIPKGAVPTLKRLEHFWASLQGPKAGAAPYFPKQTYYPLPRSEVLEMLALRRRGVEVVGDAAWQRLIAAFDRLDDPTPRFESIPGFRGELKPYQKSGVEWLGDLASLGLGGVLADDMGLGKTVQVLAHLERLRELNPQLRALVVVPSSLVYNWKSEAERFVPELAVRAFSAAESVEGPGLLIVTYGLLIEHAEKFMTASWDLAIFDEAQSLKNLSAQRTDTARRLPARIKLALTGTPIENHVGEFFSIVDLTVPGALGTWEAFQRKYPKKETPSAEDMAWLRAKARPLVLRREKRQVLSQLPPKIETEHSIEFDPEQRKLYRDTALSWNHRVCESIDELGESKSQIAMLTALLRLRQICSDPASLPGTVYEGIPPKTVALCERVAERVAQGESCIIFTQFIATLTRTQVELRRLGIPVEAISGTTSRAERERILREFQESSVARALVMTLKTGGVGLNLTRASHVFHLDPWWNPAVEDQATDRAHRMGQERVVHVVRYLMRESIEERIKGLQQSKRAQFEGLMGAETPDDLTPAAGLRRTGGYRLSRAEFEFLTE